MDPPTPASPHTPTAAGVAPGGISFTGGARPDGAFYLLFLRSRLLIVGDWMRPRMSGGRLQPSHRREGVDQLSWTQCSTPSARQDGRIVLVTDIFGRGTVQLQRRRSSGPSLVVESGSAAAGPPPGQPGKSSTVTRTALLFALQGALNVGLGSLLLPGLDLCNVIINDRYLHIRRVCCGGFMPGPLRLCSFQAQCPQSS